jgi:hypothetical protein
LFGAALKYKLYGLFFVNGDAYCLGDIHDLYQASD